MAGSARATRQLVVAAQSPITERPVHTSQTIFSRPVHWTLGVLSWLAFGIASYLAWHAITSASVAGCGVGSHNGCDVVLNSAWSKWLGIPVAVLGLACYATLAGLSVMLAIPSSMSRWMATAFVLMATLAAGASLWFIAVQVFAIGDFCLFCLTTDILGIAIGALAGWSAFRWWKGTPYLQRTGNTSATLSALRGAIPSSTRLAPVAATRVEALASPTEADHAVARPAPAVRTRTVPLVGSVTAPMSLRTFSSPPSLPIAYGGALALLVVLIGGQIVFPAKTYDVQQVALNDAVDLSVKNGNAKGTESPNGAEPHVTLRVAAEDGADPVDQASGSAASSASNENGTAGNADDSTSEAPPVDSTPEPKRERILKLLGGKLTLDVADEPVIGSPDAPHVVVEMISYDCPHCRKTNRLMKKALARYRDEVALVVLILPLEARCNKLITDPAASHADACATARMALALSKLNPALFPRFHDFLMGGDEKRPPTLADILVQAYKMGEREKLGEIRDSKEVAQQIEGYVNLFGTLRKQNAGDKNFGLPLQILGDHVVSGGVEKVEDIYKAWEQHLGVKAR
jgi:uncharacterized membrane protein